MLLPTSLLLGDVARALNVSERTARKILDDNGLGTERDSSNRRVVSSDDFLVLVAARAAEKAKETK